MVFNRLPTDCVMMPTLTQNLFSSTMHNQEILELSQKGVFIQTYCYEAPPGLPLSSLSSSSAFSSLPTVDRLLATLPWGGNLPQLHFVIRAE